MSNKDNVMSIDKDALRKMTEDINSEEEDRVIRGKNFLYDHIIAYVIYFVNRYFYNWEENVREDMVMASIEEILEHAGAYNPEKAALTTFANPYIQHACSQFLSSCFSNANNYMTQNMLKVKKAISKLEAEKGEQAFTDQEIADRSRLTVRKVHNARKALYITQPCSLEKITSGDGENREDCSYIFRQSHALSSKSPEAVFMERERVEYLERALSRLPEQERTCVILRYIENDSPAQIAGKTGQEADEIRKNLANGLRHLYSDKELLAYISGQSMKGPMLKSA